MPPSARRSSADCTKTTPSQGPNWPTPPLRTAHRGDPLRPGHRRQGEQGYRPPLSGGQHPEAIHALGVEGLSEYIKTIGLYNSKAKNVIETCRILIEKHGGQVPDNREDLEALPGVGRKTANVVLNTAFRQLAMAVDTHIFRVANRTGIAPGKNVLEVEKKLLKFVPREYLLDAHHWLILHGRYVCKARKPQCGSCRIEDLCEYKHKTSDD